MTGLCIIGWLVAGILAAIVVWLIKDYDEALDKAYEQGQESVCPSLKKN